MACSHSHHRIGWSFVELMIVICILVALLAIGFVVWGMLRSRAAISSTHTLVSSVATQLTTYSTKIWTWQEAWGNRSGQLFDLNRDGLIDGAPGVTASTEVDGGFTPEILASGYRGFVAMTGSLLKNRPSLKTSSRSTHGSGPLRIAFSVKIYGTTGFGIWSAGPDGVDGTADDLTSWTSAP